MTRTERASRIASLEHDSPAGRERRAEALRAAASNLERQGMLDRIAWLRKRVTECNEGGRPDLANDAVNKIRAIERKMEAK